MNDAIAAIALGRRIDLTREPDFGIAGVQVSPTACEVTAGGRRVRLQPRVMQVLIALARAGGEPVSREMLTEVCWGRILVGEDALNRCIQRLRRLAETEAKGAFTIETIPRIGYRMTADPAAPREPTAAGPDLAPIGKPAVAVLPFANLTGDPGQDQCAVGMTEEITRSLSRIRTLSIVATDPSLSQKGGGFRPRDPARDRSGRYVLQGSIQKAGRRLRIAVKLIDTNGGLQLWAKGFDERIEDVLALQDRVALAVAAAIEPAVVAAEVHWVLKHPSNNPGSYELYLRAMRHMTRRSKSEYLIALDLLHRAIDLDPHYRYALAQAAHLYSQIYVFGWADDPDATRLRGSELAHRAVMFAADDAVVLASAATAIARLDGDRDAAAALFERAVALNPASSYAWFLSGLHQAQNGNPDTAILHLETSLRLDPLAHRSNSVGGMAVARLRQGRLDEAVALAREFVQRTDSPHGYAYLAGALAQLDQASAAAAALRSYRALSSLPIEVFARSFLPYPVELKKFLDAIAAAEENPVDGRAG
jgi:TolB-like protein